MKKISTVLVLSALILGGCKEGQSDAPDHFNGMWHISSSVKMQTGSIIEIDFLPSHQVKTTFITKTNSGDDIRNDVTTSTDNYAILPDRHIRLGSGIGNNIYKYRFIDERLQVSKDIEGLVPNWQTFDRIK